MNGRGKQQCRASSSVANEAAFHLTGAKAGTLPSKEKAELKEAGGTG